MSPNVPCDLVPAHWTRSGVLLSGRLCGDLGEIRVQLGTSQAPGHDEVFCFYEHTHPTRAVPLTRLQDPFICLSSVLIHSLLIVVQAAGTVPWRM